MTSERPAPDTQSGGRPTEVLKIILNGATFYAVAADERARAMADARATAVAELQTALQEARDQLRLSFQESLQYAEEARALEVRAEAAESTIAGLRDTLALVQRERTDLEIQLREARELVEGLRRFMEGAYVTIREFPHGWSRCGCKSTPIMHGDYQMGATVEHGEHCPLRPAATRPVPPLTYCDHDPTWTHVDQCFVAPAAPGDGAPTCEANAAGRKRAPDGQPLLNYIRCGRPLPCPLHSAGDGALPPGARTNEEK